MQLEDLLKTFSSPGDAGMAALGFAAGFAADAFWFPGGVPSGTVAGVAAVAAFGAKKSIEALVNEVRTNLERHRQQRSNEQKMPPRMKPIEQRVVALRKLLLDAKLVNQAQVLDTELELWQQGLTTESDVESIIGALMREYRVNARPALPTPSALTHG
jgi:hypothetical protein